MSKTESPPPEHDEANDEVIGKALVGSLIVLVLIAGAAGGIYWWSQRPKELVTPPKTETKLPFNLRNVSAAIPNNPFSDITKAAGIDFKHENGAEGEKLLPETMGSGCAFLDYDNDGDQDLLLVNSCRWPWDKRESAAPATQALYQNDGTGKFTNVTKEAGLDVTFYGMGVACGDYDGDGQVDLLFTAVGKNHLFHNEGGRFEDVTEQAGVGGSDDDWGTSCGWFDCDNDGDLDLFVCHYVVWNRENDVSQNFQLVGGGRAYGRPQNFGGTFCSLYRNDGEGKFSDISAASGIQVANPDTKVPAGKSLGVVFADFDDDGRLDIVVANDTVGNFLFHNQGDGKFENIAELSGVAYDTSGMARGAMGIDVAYFRNDKQIGIAIGNFSNEPTALYVSQGGSPPQFRDDAVSNGLGPATRLELKFGVFFFDADLDGRLDLFSANGHLEEEIQRVQSSQTYPQKAHFFWNCGPQEKIEFQQFPKEKCGAELLTPMVGRGAACADIDGDGDLDIVETASGGAARLLRNDQKSGHHWLRLKLAGKSPNTDAIGAQVELYQGKSVQRRIVSPTRSYLSQCELPATFGLGESDKTEKVVIRWPSGKTQELSDLKVDQLQVVKEE
jgi:hypothetical protein